MTTDKTALCPPCRTGEHDYCVRRPDVDNPPGEWTCSCDCEVPASEEASTTTVEPSALVKVTEVAWPDRDAFRSKVALAFAADAEAMALAEPRTASERAEIGESIARFMLSARDGATCKQVVRTAVERLGPTEAMNAAETLALWALELAHAADKKAGG